MTALRAAQPLAAAALRLGLAAVFLYAGFVKAASVHAFADDIANYHLVPAALVPLVAATLPLVEIVTGLALATGLFARGAALLAAAMMAAFTAALLSAFARGIDLTCGCFGGGAEADGLTVVRDLALLAAAAHVAWFDRGRLSPFPSR